MSKSTRNWIIVGVVLLLIVIGVAVYVNRTRTNSLVGINNYDLSQLSAQDLATYNSLPNEAAKADFLRILAMQGKISTKPGTPPTGQPSPGITGIPVIDKFFDWFKNRKRTGNYVQVQPVDQYGCDALGYNAIGVRCL